MFTFFLAFLIKVVSLRKRPCFNMSNLDDIPPNHLYCILPCIDMIFIEVPLMNAKKSDTSFVIFTVIIGDFLPLLIAR